jgi:NADPH-dependent curcumin reductase
VLPLLNTYAVLPFLNTYAVLPFLNTYARIPVSELIAQYNGVGPGNGADRLPATMCEILSKSLTLRGFINSEFAGQYYDEFLRGAGMD